MKTTLTTRGQSGFVRKNRARQPKLGLFELVLASPLEESEAMHEIYYVRLPKTTSTTPGHSDLFKKSGQTAETWTFRTFACFPLEESGALHLIHELETK